GQGAVLIADSDLLAAAPGSVPGRSSRAVNRGEFITIYCTGLGDVSNRPATGYPAGTSPLSQTIESPSVTIGGVVAQVSFSGLAPGFVGLYQVNARVPPEAPTGDAVPIAISSGGKTSNAVT